MLDGKRVRRLCRTKSRRTSRQRFHSVLAALIVGTAMVSASVLYERDVDAQTHGVWNTEVITREYLASKGSSPFLSLVDELSNQRVQGQRIIFPREYLKYRAEEAGVSYALLDQIAHCESHWIMKTNAESGAHGYFQIMEHTERETPQYARGRRKEDPYTNIDMAINLFEKQGTRPWLASRDCWASNSLATDAEG